MVNPLCAILGVLCVHGIFKYPSVHRNETVVDNYDGKQVRDPYRWLENLTSVETKKFIKEQSTLTNSYLAKTPSRVLIGDTIRSIMSYESYTVPSKRGNTYTTGKQVGGQQQRVHYKSNSVEGLFGNSAEVYLDPNTMSAKGTTSIPQELMTDDGTLLAYTVSENGSNFGTIRIKNMTTGRDLPDVLDFVANPSLSWTHNKQGLLYSRYPPNNEDWQNEKLYFHRLGTQQNDDELVIEFPENPGWSVQIHMTEDREHTFIKTYVASEQENIFYTKTPSVWNKDVQHHLVNITKDDSSSFTLLGSDASTVYFLTNAGAPRKRLIAMDVNQPDMENWRTIVPEHEKDVLSWAHLIDTDKIVMSYKHDVKDTVEIRRLSDGGVLQRCPVEDGIIDPSPPLRTQKEFFFKLSNLANPGSIYSLTFGRSGQVPTAPKLIKATKLGGGVDPSAYIMKQVFFNSKDGTRVPMFIMHKKNLVPSSNTPTLLVGWGSGGIVLEPRFQGSGEFAFAHMYNGIYAVANVRGGGEYGTSWWNDGRLLNKQHSFDDFISAAEYLIKQGYTSPSKLTIKGAEADGGLLIATSMNQRPDLFGAGTVEGGLLDMLRYSTAVGSFPMCEEYGCSKDSSDIRTRLSYSPIHNINGKRKYPALLVITNPNDEVVAPWHSYKYIAEMQATVGHNRKQIQPLLLKVKQDGTQAAIYEPTETLIQNYVDKYSFLESTLNYKHSRN